MDAFSHLKVKPVCKPDVHLKKSRKRIFNENSVRLSYSFGYQSKICHNIAVLNERIVIIIAGNYLNFLDLETMKETFLPSVHGAGFGAIEAYSPESIFAAAERGENMCINIYMHPDLKPFKTLKEEFTIMPSRLMKFHPNGELLISASDDPENKVIIYLWKKELVLYDANVTYPVYDIHYASWDFNVFVTSGIGHIRIWNLDIVRDDLGDISKLTVVQEEKRLQESSKLSIYCTVSLSEQMYLSSTEEGHIFLWNPELLSTNDAVEVRKFDSSFLHDGSVNYIIIHENFMITFGSDGQFKFWEYANVLQQLHSECSSESEEELEDNNLSLKNIEDEKVLEVNKKLDYLSLETIHEFTVSKNSDLAFAILHSFENDQIMFFIQDRQGFLWQAQVTSGFSKVVCSQLLSGLGCSLTDLAMCPLYPLIAATSNTGYIIVYDCVAQEILRQVLHSAPANCLIWPDAQFDSAGASLIVGFQDGTLRTFSIVKDTENLVLQYAIKSHTSSVQNLSINASCTVLVTQGLDSKLFFYSVGGLAYIPVGFYINNHEIDCLEWLTYNPGSKENEESILLICKHSYIIEVRVPKLYEFREKITFRQTYFIETSEAQIHKLNGLRKYHELGDRIYDSDCEEKPDLNEAGKQVLVKLKYAAKKEARENLEKEFGFFGPLSPPKILCCLMSAYSDRIWLSLGKEDFGYLFEFGFTGRLSEEPLEMIPINALEILTAERINVLCLNYSPCGKFLFMGLENGSLNICRLENSRVPSSGYDFAKYQVHDADYGSIKHLKVSNDGSIIVTVGEDGNIFVFNFCLFKYKEITDYGEMPLFMHAEGIRDIDGNEVLSCEEELVKNLNEKYNIMKQQNISIIEDLRNQYLLFEEQYVAYYDVCEVAIKRVPHILLELQFVITPFPATVEKFTKETDSFIKTLDLEYEKNIVRASLLQEKYHQIFKNRIEFEKSSVKKGEKIIWNFRGCSMPLEFLSTLSQVHSKVFELRKEKKDVPLEKLKDKKKSETLLNLENQLLATRKSIIEYPIDTPVSEIIFKYNKRKENYIRILEEHIAAYEAFENISEDESQYTQTVAEIESSYFKFKGSEVSDETYSKICTFTEKKEKVVSFMKKVYRKCKEFNLNLKSAFRNEIESDSEKAKGYFCTDKEYVKYLDYKDVHICSIKNENQGNTAIKKIDWTNTEYNHHQMKSTENKGIRKYKLDSSVTRCSTLNENSRMDFRSNLHAIMCIIKPKINCEKKFGDIRLCLECIELNNFKNTLAKERKWLKVTEELEKLLNAENKDLAVIEDEILILRKHRQNEKKNWINLYDDLIKLIGRKHKHKGYYKKVFKKKIRPVTDKEPNRRHTSSESSGSEQNIESEDDFQSVDRNDIDQELLRKVTYLRIERQEIENRMKEYKRKIKSATLKQNISVRKIQKINDALTAALNELNSVLTERMLIQQHIKRPLVLYPDNVHSDYIDEPDENIDQQKRLVAQDMSKTYKIVSKQIEVTNKYVELSLLTLMNKIVSLEVHDLIDIVFVFFPILEFVSISTDTYFKSLVKYDSSEKLSDKDEILEKKKPNFISDILSTLEEPRPDANLKLEIKKDDRPFNRESKASKLISHDTLETKAVNKIDLDYFDSNLGIAMKDYCFEPLSSWREVCDDAEFLGLLDKHSLDYVDTDEIISTAAVHLDCSDILHSNCSSTPDYYMSPLNYSWEKGYETESNMSNIHRDDQEMLIEIDINEVLDNLLEKVIDMEETFMKEDSDELSDPDFPTFAGGGLILRLPVLKNMERDDPDSFPYSNYYQKIEEYEELLPKPVYVQIIPPREYEIEPVYELKLKPFTDFIAVRKDDISKLLYMFYDLKSSTNQRKFELRLCLTKVMETKNMLIAKQQEMVSIERDLKREMMSKFGHTIDLNSLQDSIENPHYIIKKFEMELALSSLKNELNRVKASEMSAVKSLDKLCFEDTKICYELLELREDFKLLNKSYSSKWEVLPKTSATDKTKKEEKE